MGILPGTRRLVLLALLTAAATAATAGADPVRLSLDVPGESKPIQIDADEITTWVEGDTRVVLPRGQVLVQQGVVRARFQEGAVLIDLKRYQAARVWAVTVYAEGNVVLQNGSDVTEGTTGLLDLHTRGELKLNAHKGKVAREARPGDAVYRRALERRTPARGGLSPDPVKTVSFEEPAPPVVPVQNTTTTPPLPVPPIPPAPAETSPPAPPVPPGNPAGGPLGALVPAGPATTREYSIVPRNPAGFQLRSDTDKRTGENVLVAIGGLLITVRVSDGQGRLLDVLDIETDRVVVWTSGDAQQLVNNLRGSQGAQTKDELEFYLSGNVEIRSRSGAVDRTLRAEEIYYDVRRNVALAVGADVELMQPGIVEPVHFRAAEVEQLSPALFRATRGEFFASRLPSDPGLKVSFARATLENRTERRPSVLGRLLGTAGEGPPVAESLVRAEDVFVKIEDVPVFYLPFLQGDARDPLGPVDSIHVGANRVFGFQFGVGLDVFDLLGIDRPPGTRWRLDVDYLSRRGPALGTNLDFAGKDLFGVPSRYAGQLRAWGLYDDGRDILGGGRGENESHPLWRGRADFRAQVWDMPLGFTLQSQVVGLSDKNFLEQFYKREFDEDPNKETFLYLKQQQDHWAWSLLAEPRLRDWVTETEWLPRADGAVVGQSFFDLLTYSARASAGYARLRPTEEPPFSVLPTDVAADTGRFDLMQEVSLPFALGPVKVVPYGVLDLTYYTRDLTGDDTGRAYGGGGVRASVPFSRLYPDTRSLLFNVNGLYHKIVLSGNYYAADATDRFTRFPQLDRLDDDATDQARRDLRPLLPFLNPSHGTLLATSPLFDPQIYAIRRGVMNRVDTLDRLDVVRLELAQRWQTKRGFPGRQHVIDWMSLDLSGSAFPRAGRDNFGETFAFLEYAWDWNVGDRTAVYSTGWLDPIDDGPRVFTLGATVNRPDRTYYSVGYRLIEPVGSHAVSGALTYVFSPKYAMTAMSLYDFGTNQSLSNSLVLTRMGTDLQVSLGITYNALQNNLGFTFEVLPNLVAPGRRVPGLGVGPGLFGR